MNRAIWDGPKKGVPGLMYRFIVLPFINLSFSVR